MPTKGNVWRITSTIPYNIIQKGCIKENYERAKKAEDFASGLARNSASLSFPVQPFSLCYGVCLSGGAKRRHLSMTSTRRGDKIQIDDKIIWHLQRFFCFLS